MPHAFLDSDVSVTRDAHIVGVRGPGHDMIATNGQPTERILVVDGDSETVAVVTYTLALEGYDVSTAMTGEDAIQSVSAERPDLIVLELSLPDISGLDLVKRLRSGQATNSIGLVMLSSKCAESDRIEGLTAGVDDYVGKPFSPAELVLRVASVLRRLADRTPGADPVSIGGLLTIDRVQPRAWVDTREILLTPTEHRLLSVLAEGVGRIRTRSELLESVWHMDGDRQTRTVDAHVRRIRAKLGNAGKLIESVRGLGYRLVAE